MSNQKSAGKVRKTFPHKVRKIENVWIPMRNGARLSASIWMPENAEQEPVPAILEYIPYRKDDGTALRDSLRHPYFAGFGYASLRVDLRGSGDSDGILYDEYLPQEQDDALEVLSWIEKQPWSNGAVGIIGKSWGGFNGLQIAARRPPQLKAVVTLCSTDDRYADDVHFKGGCLLASETLQWASTMLLYNGQPPDPKITGQKWRSIWLERLENTPPFIEEWMRHQRRDGFWKQGSVCESFDDIKTPVLAVGGWADGYTNAVFRLLEGLSVPRKGIIGPWVHEYPEVAVPEPAIGFLQECLRWWDYWLKGIDTGIMGEPMLRVWMQNSVPPKSYYPERPGRWIGESAWPSPHIADRFIWPGEENRLRREQPDRDGRLKANPVQSHGLYSGVFCPNGEKGDLPSDQRPEDGVSATFTSEPLEVPTEILGFPEATVELSSDRPQALIAARLCDVSPDDSSTLVSWGMLNLAHRDSHESPSPLVPGKRYVVTFKLNAIGHVISAGHRWRLALAPTFWPHAWPSPEPAALQIYTGSNTFLKLPVRTLRAKGGTVTFGPPETAEIRSHEIVRKSNRTRKIGRDLITDTWKLTDLSDGGIVRLLPDGLRFGEKKKITFSIRENDPLSARVRVELTAGFEREEWKIQLKSRSTMQSDRENFYIRNQLTAYENGRKIFSKKRDFSVPRDFI